MSSIAIELINISRLLSSFSDDVRNSNEMGNFFINSIAEDIAQPILSILFDCDDLKNLNSETGKNYTAIDLGDTKKRLSFQITSDNSLDKIQKTLEKFVNNDLYNQYDELYIYIIKDNKQSTYSDLKIKKILKDINFNFNIKKHILDNSDILRLIRERLFSKPEKIVKIRELLSKHYGDVATKLIPVNVETTNFIFPTESDKVYLSEDGALKYSKVFEENNAEDSYYSGVKSFESKNYEEAKSSFNNSIEAINKNMAQVLTDIGVTFCCEGDIELGIKNFEKAIDLNPNHAKIRHNLGYSYFKLGEYRKAINELEIALKSEPDDFTKDILLNCYYQEAIIFSSNENYQESLKLFNRMNEISPNDENTLINIGVDYIAMKDYDKAIKHFNQLIEKNLSNYLIYFNLASAYSGEGDNKQALELCQKALRINKEGRNLNYKIAMVYSKLNDIKQTIDYLKKEIELYPESDNSYQSLVYVYTFKEEYQNDILSFVEKISLKSKSLASYRFLATVYSRQKDNKKLLDILLKTIGIYPNELRLNHVIGILYYENKEYEKSIKYYQKELKLDSSNPEIFYNLSISYSMLNNTDLCLDNLSKAISLKSEYKKIVRENLNFKYLFNNNTFINLVSDNGITKISLKGYKSIISEQTIDIKPLTILAGANSSGKSSFIQPILLMKQTIESSYDAGALLLNGSNINFTSVNQFLSKYDNKNINNFSIDLSDENTNLKSYFLNKDNNFNLEKIDFSDNLDNYSFTLNYLDKEKPIIYSNNIALKFLNIENLDKNNWYVNRTKCFLGITKTDENQLHIRTSPSIEIIINGNFEKYIRELIHLPGIRGNPERGYPTTNIDIEKNNYFPGRFENYVANIIYNWQINKNIDKLNSLKEDIEILGINKNITTNKINDVEIEIKVSRAKNSNNDDLVNISDVGLGVSQSLPILVALNVAKPNQMVYIEQPELHLHPRAQINMAKVLSKASKRGVKVIVETHSSLLLLAIQTLIAQEELDPNLVKLHWFSQDESGSTKVTSSNLDENGAFGDWPEDFGEIELTSQSEYLDAIESKMVDLKIV